MGQYTFGGKTFTLKKNTFVRERQAKEAAGITEEHETVFPKLIYRQQLLMNSLVNTEGDKREKILDELDELNKKVEALSNSMIWYENIEKVKTVLRVILEGDVDSLTEGTIGKFDAQEVWQDFFTSPSQRKSGSKESQTK